MVAVLVLAGCAACTSPAIRYGDGPAASGDAPPGPVSTIPPEWRSRAAPPADQANDPGADPGADPGVSDDSAAEAKTRRRQTARIAAIELNGNPDKLMGLRRVELPATLGAPMLVRQDGPSEVWQYEAKGCVLDVFLYRGSTAADLAVVHVEGRDKHGEPINTSRCLSAVEDNRAPLPTG